MTHWTTPWMIDNNVKGTTPDWNKEGTYQTTNLYPDDMYKRSKRFKKPDEEVTEEMDNEGYLYSKGWQKVSSNYWTHPQYAATFSTDEALKKSGEMDQTQKAVNDSHYLKNPYEDKTNNLEYWKLKYCEKSDEVESLRKTLYEYKGELEALREDNEHLKKRVDTSEKGMGLLNQSCRERDNKIHYLEVELDNYRILMNENKDLEESLDKTREIFEKSLQNASQDDLRAFQDILDSYHADRVMEDTEDTVEPFERTAGYSADLDLDEERQEYDRCQCHGTDTQFMEDDKEEPYIGKLSGDKVFHIKGCICHGTFNEELENFKEARKELSEVLAQAKETLNRLQGDDPYDW